MTERNGRNWRMVLRELAEPFLGFVIPDRDHTVRSCGSECIVPGRDEIGKTPRFGTELCLQWMEGERIHGPHVVDIVYCLPMAFERILLVLDFWGGVNVLHRDPPFDRCRGIT